MSVGFTQEQKERVNEMIITQTTGLLKTMKEDFGEGVYDAYVKTYGEKVRQQWGKIAEQTGDNSIEAFLKLLYQPSGTNGSEYMMEETEDGFQFTCSKCRTYETAVRYGITEQMFYMSCALDPFIVEGFNPNIGFKRTKTRMQGHDCCDHFYYYKNKTK